MFQIVPMTVIWAMKLTDLKILLCVKQTDIAAVK